MKFIPLLAILLLSITGHGQYYYNDLISNDLSNKQYQLLQTNKIKNVTAISYDNNNTPIENFVLKQEISADGKQIVTTSALANRAPSELTITFTGGKIRKTKEISNIVETNTTYTYSDKGLLLNVASSSSDTSVKYKTTEVHIWNYNEQNKPTLMLKVKNQKDTTRIEFVFDEQNNVAEEHWRKNGKEIETYYYYYDAQNRLTDVVRFNNRYKKLLPDYLYEYDDQNRITKVTQTSNGSNYITWRYTYDSRNLKDKEICYDSKGTLLGKIEYAYKN
ncbi:hypothetical protein ACI6Q2_11060 [Chitinophagaceae bacterium LWZ2-11]